MSDERQAAAVAHLASFAGYLIPFGNIIGPLVVWILKKEEMPFVDEHGREAINFQISISIWLLISAVLVFVVVGIL